MQTVFSPLSVLGRLANGDREAVRGWMQSHADDVHGALDAITSTLADYAKACLSEGADGIFFATTEWGTYDNATWEEYEAFGRPYDLRVLGAAAGAPFNVLHVCRPHSMLERLIDYPVAAFNWAVHEDGNPSLAEAQELTDRAVMGGVDQVGTLLNGSAADVAGQVRDAVAQTGGWRLLIAPGCSIAPETPPENIRAAVEAARSP
jgi:uroporphyrinogen decarboxylase